MNQLIQFCATQDFSQQICDFLSMLASLKDEQVMIGLVIISGAIVAVIKSMIRVFRFCKQQILKSHESRKLCESFSDKDFEEAGKNYIEPNGASIDPSNYDDLRALVPVKQPIMAAIDDAINNTISKKLILILADSGMGKTTFLLNYALRKFGQRKRISLVSLSRTNALAQIAKVQNQRDTILLLDAFDEDTKAIDDIQTRISEILESAQNFSNVIMTCRTQFFIQDSEIPLETVLPKSGPKRAGQSGFYEWQKIYLLPFNEEQISKFIYSVIPFYNWGTRKKAKALVRKIPELAARPMLLNLIPEIASRKIQIDNIWDLYEFMVSQWAEREKGWIGKKELISISKSLAFDIFSNRASRGTERININDLNTVFKDDFTKHGIESWQFRSRSLLNRDSEGNYKFAHRSIMEYFFVLDFIDGNDEAAKYKWTDMMCELFINCGHANKISKTREQEIFNLDLRETSIFPLPPKTLDSGNINEAWAKSVLQNKLSNASDFPASWRKFSSKILTIGNTSRVYDFASGSIYQYIDTTEFSSSDLEPYSVNRGIDHWKDLEDRDWVTPKLFEIKTFIEILSLNRKLQSLDSRVLYWLSDSDSTKKNICFHMWLPRGPRISEHIGLTKFYSTELSIEGTVLGIDLFMGSLKATPMNFVRAVPIQVHHGHALEMHFEDLQKNSNDSWGLMDQYYGYLKRIYSTEPLFKGRNYTLQGVQRKRKN
ncbi:NACHT domain-containing NTPase [Methylophilus sp. Leaf414]|uniref:NACHT domain-containing protein n=1 Tax=Methylophilus sp. Leaf414 TaxID=1736371 RepID=UPI0006F7C330|nr:hypothetical protein [Methylophilus sp. Leaf414]KQT34145.1 hypothetical protein ASG24_10370 [Methylophilus sp. Leaf414]